MTRLRPFCYLEPLPRIGRCVVSDARFRRMIVVSTPEEHENYLEMFDFSTKTQVVKAPLASTRFVSR